MIHIYKKNININLTLSIIFTNLAIHYKKEHIKPD
jgi:hypothetical protein